MAKTWCSIGSIYVCGFLAVAIILTMIERLGDDIRKAREVLAELRRQITEAKLVLSVPAAEVRLAELTAKVAEAEDQARQMWETAQRDSEAIKARGTLDAQAAIEAANQRISEIITQAEGRANELLERARAQRENDLTVSNARIHNLEARAIAEMERVQRIHAEQLALEQTYIDQRKALLEKAR
jgi:hypothetical protein